MDLNLRGRTALITGGDSLRRKPRRRGAQAVAPPKAHRSAFIDCDDAMYERRHLMGHFFCHLKRFRHIATRHQHVPG